MVSIPACHAGDRGSIPRIAVHKRSDASCATIFLFFLHGEGLGLSFFLLGLIRRERWLTIRVIRRERWLTIRVTGARAAFF